MSISSSMNKRRQSGAAMVELAILVFLMVLLFIGMAELGRALYFQQKLTKSVEGAARYLGRSWDAVTADCAQGTNWGDATFKAANIAVYGNEAGSGEPIIPLLETDEYSFSTIVRAVPDVGNVCVVRAEVTTNYHGIFFVGGGILPPPILGNGGGGAWEMHAVSEERYVGD